jgi:hypothetical protein
MADDRTEAVVANEAPNLDRRRTMFRIALATASAATALYMAPVVFRIDDAEAKGSKRKKGSKRRKSRRRRGTHPTRRRRSWGW